MLSGKSIAETYVHTKYHMYTVFLYHESPRVVICKSSRNFNLTRECGNLIVTLSLRKL